MKAIVKCTQPRYICANERIKLIGTLDSYFPDFGHHLLGEMGGLWLHPIKVLDGFWMHFSDHTHRVKCWMMADQFENHPEKNVFHFSRELGPTCISSIRTQIAPLDIGGILVSYTFVNNGKEVCECTTNFLVRSNLRPGWLAECSGVFDGYRDEAVYDEKENIFIIKDCEHPWYAAVGCNTLCDRQEIGEIYGPENVKGNGIGVSLEHNFSLKAGEHKILNFYIAASDVSKEDVEKEYGKLKEYRDFEAEKKQKQQEMYLFSELENGDKTFEDIYRWVKVNTEWLILKTSSGDRGIMGGVPEYTWWFGCDSCYTVQGLLAIGEYQLSRDTLNLILKYSKQVNGNGRIVHEILPDGYCTNPGNVQETALFVATVWKYFQWTGDQTLLDEAFEYLSKSVLWLQEQDDDDDCFPTGYGIIEIAGLNMEMIDTAVYTWEAYIDYSRMCNFKGLEKEAVKYEKLAEKVALAIEDKLWDEENGLYCDGYTSFNMIVQRREMIDELLKHTKNEKMRQYVERILEERKEDGDKERGWLINRNWVINTPMETGLASKERAEKALKNLHTSDYVGKWGMYLCGLKQEHIMTISTGVMAAAQARYGYADRALELIEKIFKTFSAATPGSICEMSPDWGCFAQAWTVYAVMYPITRFFFGVHPKASENIVEIVPCIPSKWEKSSLKKVRVLNGEISLFYEIKEDMLIFRIENPARLYLVFCNNDKKLISLNDREIDGGKIQTDEINVTAIYKR